MVTTGPSRYVVLLKPPGDEPWQFLALYEEEYLWKAQGALANSYTTGCKGMIIKADDLGAFFAATMGGSFGMGGITFPQPTLSPDYGKFPG